MVIEKENLSRRNFIKNSGLFAGGIVLASTVSPFKFVYATKKPEGKGKWYGIGIDI